MVEQARLQQKLIPGWKAEISSILRWIEDHSKTCAAVAIFLPGLSILYYIRREGVPLSFTSSDLLVALPLVLVFISLVTVVMSATLLVPLSAMFEDIERGADGKLQLLPPKGSARLKALGLWLLILSTPGLLIAGALFWNVTRPYSPEWPIPTAIGLSTILCTWLTRHTMRHEKRKSILTDSLPVALLAVLAQMLLTTLAMRWALRLVGDDAGYAAVLSALVLATFVLALLQICCAAIIEATSALAGSVTQACFGAAIAITLACLVPTTSAALAGGVIRVTAPDGKRCMQLRLADMNKFAALRDKESADRTADVEVLANINSAYFVRKHVNLSGSVHRIPADDVLELLSCPPPNKGAGSNKPNTTGTASSSKPRA